MQYEEVVKMIKESTEKVDEVLKAAKLQRYEREPLSERKLEMLLNFILLAILLIGVSIAVCMIIYFAGR